MFIGGNRSGKTVAGAAEAVMWLTGTHLYSCKFKPPVRGRAIAVDFDNGVDKIIKPEIARWIPPSFLKNGSWEDSYSRGTRVLTLTNGSTLEFMSYDQDVDKFAGTSRHFVWFDEEPPEDIYNENMARLIDTGGHWWMTMTPLIDMSWTDERLYQRGKSGLDTYIDVFEVSTTQNLYVSAAEIDILTEGMSDEEKKARLHGMYMGQSNLIYRDVVTPANFIPSLVDNDDRWPLIYKGWGHFGMLDHGYRNPTAFYLGAYDTEGRIIIYKEYYESGRLVKENAQEILKIIKDLRLENVLNYIVADPSIQNRDPISGSSIHAEYAEHGLYLGLANNDVSAGINRVSSRFKNKLLYITDDCPKLKWELGRYRWDKFQNSRVSNRNNLKETPVKKDDHAMDALRYGVVSRPALPGEEEIRVGNVLNAPVSIGEDFIDREILTPVSDNPLTDAMLGSEW